MTRDHLASTLWAAGAAAAGLWLAVRLQAVVTPLLVAWFVAYIFDPVLDRLEGWRVPRAAGVVALLFALAAAATAATLLVIPSLAEQVQAAAKALPGYVRSAEEALGPRVEGWLGRPLSEELADRAAAAARGLQESLPGLVGWAAGAARRVFAEAWGLVGALLGLALIPVFAFYLLLDFNGLGQNLVDLLPAALRPAAQQFLDRSDAVLGAFVRGQLTVCAVLAVVYSLGLTLVGIDMPWVVGIASGLLFIVPYLGTFFGVALGSVLALLKFHDLAHLLGVWGVFAGAQLLEGFVLTPRIVGDRVGLHPLAVIVAILAAGELFGFVGILLAVPGAAVLRVGAGEALARYRASALHRGAEP
ncbi:MAG: AI-2E family transporter [Deferrisomatales bacterium]